MREVSCFPERVELEPVVMRPGQVWTVEYQTPVVFRVQSIIIEPPGQIGVLSIRVHSREQLAESGGVPAAMLRKGCVLDTLQTQGVLAIQFRNDGTETRTIAITLEGLILR